MVILYSALLWLVFGMFQNNIFYNFNARYIVRAHDDSLLYQYLVITYTFKDNSLYFSGPTKNIYSSSSYETIDVSIINKLNLSPKML